MWLIASAAGVAGALALYNGYLIGGLICLVVMVVVGSIPLTGKKK